jgi:hypothetical protein
MGGYGSFLYPERSLSVISQSRSPAVPPNHGNASRSPYVPVEVYFCKFHLYMLT